MEHRLNAAQIDASLRAMCGIYIDESHTLSREQFAARLFATLPTQLSLDGDYSIPLAVVKGACMREMYAYLDSSAEMVIGAGLDFDYLSVASCGSRLHVRAWVEDIGKRSLTFRICLRDELGQIGEGRMTFAVIPRAAEQQRALLAAGAPAKPRWPERRCEWREAAATSPFVSAASA